MFIGQSLACLEFDDQTIFNKQIRKVVTKDRAVFITDLEGVLLFDIQPLFAKSVSKAVLVDFLKVAMTKVSMESKSRFPNLITQCKYLSFCLHPFPLCVSCAFLRPTRRVS